MLSVASLLSGIEAVGGLLRRSSAAGSSPVAAASEAAPANATGDSSRSSLLKELASHHDLRNISPNAFSNLVRQLHQAGLINERQLQDLAAVRLELDLAELPPDQPIDLIAFLENKLQRLHGQAGLPAPSGGALSATDYNEAADRTMRQLELLRELEQARSSSVDATI